MKVYDIHCHIDWFTEEELSQVADDVDKIYGASISYDSAIRVLAISKKHHNIKAAIGIHPEYFKYYDEFPRIKELIINNKNKIYAIGEIGLPYFSLLDKNQTEKDFLYNKALILFENFLILAKELDLPVVLHATQSTSIYAYNLLQKHNIKNVLFHWLHCDFETAKKIFDAGYFASASVDILYNKPYLEFVKKIPLENLLLESDSPWEYDDTRSRPKDILKVLEVISKEKDIPKIELSLIFKKNTEIFTRNR